LKTCCGDRKKGPLGRKGCRQEEPLATQRIANRNQDLGQNERREARFQIWEKKGIAAVGYEMRRSVSEEKP